MNTDQVQIHLGETIEDAGARFVGAWRRMERGGDVSEQLVSFSN